MTPERTAPMVDLDLDRILKECGQYVGREEREAASAQLERDRVGARWRRMVDPAYRDLSYREPVGLAELERRAKRVEVFNNASEWVAPRSSTKASDAQLVASLMAERSAGGVLVEGGSQLGKSSLAIAAARYRFTNKPEAVLVVWAPDLVNARLQRAQGREAQLVDEALRVPLLVLDDLGQDAKIPTSPIVEIIHKRAARHLPTWVTTGWTQDQIETTYGANVWLRLITFRGRKSLRIRCLPPAGEKAGNP